ncbi:MAG: hypothetical protein IJ600_05200 [Lachnospiraceae bacterium]|nr:hypothetical protein [Lachnospiraceae bacterium]
MPGSAKTKRNITGILTREEELRAEYTRKRFGVTLTPEDVETSKTDYNDYMAQIKDAVEPECLEWKIADFKQDALKSGWTVEDMPLLEAIYEMVDKEEGPALREIGDELIGIIRNGEFDTLSEKNDILDAAASLVRIYRDVNKEDHEHLQTLIEGCQQRQHAPAEYPKDKEFQEHMRQEGYNAYYKAKSGGKEKMQMLANKGLEHNKSTEEEKKEVRNKSTYMLQQLTQKELDTHTMNISQEKKDIKRLNRDIMKDIFGDDVYYDLDALYMGDEKEREVNIHHSRGSRQMDAGEHVLELDFAGSGFSEARRDYHGLDGKSAQREEGDTTLDEHLNAQYGPRVQNIMGVELPENSLYRMKTTERDGNKKTRISIPGPSSEKGELGATNTGNYKIENTSGTASAIIQNYLKSYMDEWKAKKDVPGFKMKPIHINITGHSRGGVAAGETVKMVNAWLTDEVRKDEALEGFSNLVHYDLLQRDPVPGPNVPFKNVDLRDVKNLNATTIYTTAADNFVAGIGFTPEAVRGQKRVIIGTTPHSAGLEGADLSQLDVKQDQKVHQWGYLDASTQEYYRGSGIADMPEGIYFSDEKRNLFRVESYSQLDKLIDGMGQNWFWRQDHRFAKLHEAVRDYFVDNEINFSYPTEEKREEKLKEMAETRNKLLSLKTDNRYVNLVQECIKDAEQPGSFQLDPEKEKRVFTACRGYMANSKVPASGKEKEAMELVSDYLTAASRERNFRNKGFNAHMTPEQKENYEKRNRQAAESAENRLDTDNVMIDRLTNAKLDIAEIASRSKELLDRLDKAGRGNDKAGYDKMHSTLVQASLLSGENSPAEVRNLLREMKKASDDYLKSHSGLFQGRIGGGAERKKSALLLKELAADGIKTFSEHAKGLDSSRSINESIIDYSEKKESLQDKENAEKENAKKEKQKKQQRKERIEKYTKKQIEQEWVVVENEKSAAPKKS